MISTRRAGFTLVELMVVAVLAGIMMGAAYQSLITQGRANRTTGDIIRGQDALRASFGILEAELRENATMGGAPMGVIDLVAAAPDSMTVRAQRKVGFVCSVHSSERRVFVWVLGRDQFRRDDGVLIFADDNPNMASDDVWLPGRVTQVQAASEVCPSRPAGSTGLIQRVDLGGLDGTSLGGQYLDTVLPGAPVRGFEQVTYRLISFNGEYGLGRRGSTEGAEAEPLILGLAGEDEGLVFSYLDADGALITADPVPLETVAGVRITARTQPRPGTRAAPVTVTSDIFFRNN